MRYLPCVATDVLQPTLPWYTALDQPKLAETGPFGYVKRTTKYDIRFSPDFSDKVTYRSWVVYDPVRAALNSK